MLTTKKPIEIKAKIAEICKDSNSFTDDNYGSEAADNGEFEVFFSECDANRTIMNLMKWLFGEDFLTEDEEVLNAQLTALITSKRKTHAVDLYQQSANVTLKEAKEYVNLFENRLRFDVELQNMKDKLK